MGSVLNDVKKYIGFEADYTVYDKDLIMLINSGFAELAQIGYGPIMGVKITSADETWDGLFQDETNQLELVKEYINLRTRNLFDPPQSTAVLNANVEHLKKLEWRLSISSTFQEG